MSLPGTLLVTFVALSALMAAAWGWQRRTHNIGWVDVFWTFGTAAAGLALSFAWSAPDGSTARRLLVCALAAGWSLRLGLHVARRVAGAPEDGRYRELRQNWGAALQPRLFGFLQLQALVGLVLGAAIALAANRPGPLGAQDAAGAAVALLAIAGESRADRQMKAFAADPANRGRVMDRGLWALSRHPNYLFEWLAWIAYPVFALDPAGGYSRGAWALAAPVVMYFGLRFGAGVPPLEAHMLRTRGEAFRAYQRRTPVFLPFSLAAKERNPT
ncbi:MAG: DUF1295 domain-containing protein [Alphaproteobacteria bacterium]|nr:DUF1295 domain-containing protein [Alphaproteobacteria bacterium]